MNIFVICFIVYLLVMSVVLFACMGIDKRKAENNQWRIKEMTLFTLAAVGGALGGIAGMKLFRHKSQKGIFHAVFGISLVLHIIILFLVIRFS